MGTIINLAQTPARFPRNDSHALRSTDGQALNFLEFHVPGVFRTNYDG